MPIPGTDSASGDSMRSDQPVEAAPEQPVEASPEERASHVRDMSSGVPPPTKSSLVLRSVPGDRGHEWTPVPPPGRLPREADSASRATLPRPISRFIGREAVLQTLDALAAS